MLKDLKDIIKECENSALGWMKYLEKMKNFPESSENLYYYCELCEIFNDKHFEIDIVSNIIEKNLINIAINRNFKDLLWVNMTLDLSIMDTSSSTESKTKNIHDLYEVVYSEFIPFYKDIMDETLSGWDILDIVKNDSTLTKNDIKEKLESQYNTRWSDEAFDLLVYMKLVRVCIGDVVEIRPKGVEIFQKYLTV